MDRRDELVHVIQQLAREEAGRQPSAADWLAEQDLAVDKGTDRGTASGDPKDPQPGAGAQEPESP